MIPLRIPAVKFFIVNYLAANPRGIERKFGFDLKASLGAFKSRLSSKKQKPKDLKVFGLKNSEITKRIYEPMLF